MEKDVKVTLTHSIDNDIKPTKWLTFFKVPTSIRKWQSSSRIFVQNLT